MIKGIAPTGRYTLVSSGSTNLAHIYQNSNNPMQGMMRISGSDTQVFDGSGWLTMTPTYATVGLSPTAESILDWARQKRDEEAEILILAETNPTIKSLVDEMNKYKNQIEMVKILMKDEVKI